MSKENVDLVRRVFGELAADLRVNDVDRRLSDAVLAEFLHPQVEYVPVAQSLLAVDSYHGFDGIRRFWREFLSTWDKFVVKPIEVVDAGDQVAVAMQMAGRRGDLEVDVVWSSLYTIRDGKIARIQAFTNRDEAFKAAGLDE
jgi:ketosteroid isomerase-like protein